MLLRRYYGQTGVNFDFYNLQFKEVDCMSLLVTQFYTAEFAMVIWTLRKKDKKRLTSKEIKISEEQKDTQFFYPKGMNKFSKVGK
jgi:hypothetical protein